MLVLRVEDPDRVGPYNSFRYCECPYDSVTHPIPESDAGIMRRVASDEFCGFTAYSQLRAWFNGYFASLAAAGFDIAVYDAQPEDVTVGTRQCLFYRDKAKLVKRIPAQSFVPAEQRVSAISERAPF